MLIIGLIGLVVSAFAATKFEEIAKMKGHSGYFWWCFLLGPAGWAMVIALPVKTSTYAIPEKNDDLPEL